MTLRFKEIIHKCVRHRWVSCKIETIFKIPTLVPYGLFTVCIQRKTECNRSAGITLTILQEFQRQPKDTLLTG